MSLRPCSAFFFLLLPSLSLSQSFITGTPLLSGPYGIDPSAFLDTTTHTGTNISFPIKGYNTSIPAGPVSGTGNSIPGWSLNIAITPDVSLSGSDSQDASKFFEATTLSITPPSRNQAAGLGRFNGSDWRVCALVFTAGLGGAETEKAKQQGAGKGDCSELLPSDCINQLQVNSVTNVAERGGGCQGEIKIPSVCNDHFGGRGGNDVMGFEMAPVGDGGGYGDRRSTFFAAGSEGVEKGNKTALATAQGKVWPVLLVWTHFAEDGDVHDSEGGLSCVKGEKTVDEGEDGDGDGDGDDGGKESGVSGNLKEVVGWKLLVSLIGAAAVAFAV
ncbi:hypothetical protein QBC44DRAFT_121561 [Cladorrhinum sp. PSN332]|nr:hypothetical protein QBC44DRAFT_121561 [Cladorrhinum sp. PSN332]